MIVLYRGLSRAAAPLLRIWLDRRVARGREDPARLGERFGTPGAQRPAGALVWVHGASVGEALSALALIERIRAARPDACILVTTGTVTSAKLMQARLPPGAIHQYVPVDVPAWVDRFMAHWRPDLALWIESEIWPNLLSAARRSGASLVLVNGRLSSRSFRRWRRAPRTIGRLLGWFDLCIAQSEDDAVRFRRLGAPKVVCRGNLKHSAPPMPCDPDALASLRAAIGRRPVWLAASTHPGEEEQVADAHRRLRERHSALLTIIAPRHAVRGGDVARRLGSFRIARRSAGALPDEATEIYLADTMGELGLLFRVAPVVFVGGSLVPHGGQNPLEPARLGCAVLHGRHMHNFAEIAAEMEAASAAVQVANAEALAAEAERLLSDPAVREAAGASALSFAEGRTGTLDAVVEELKPHLDALPPHALPPHERPRARA